MKQTFFLVPVGRSLGLTTVALGTLQALDRRGVKWKVMKEINFVDIHYKPFDASKWDVTPSGLLGPVTLTPVKAMP